LFNLDDVDKVFEAFHQLKYSEKLTIKLTTEEDLVIIPYAAGHLIGGSIWKIQKETEEIIYAIDYNHRSEHILSKTVLDQFNRPSLLITDSFNFFHSQPKLKDRDASIMKTILKTLRANGNILIPCDSSGRILELLRVLDQYWISNKLQDPICLLHDMSYYVPKNAQAMLEWCNEKLSKNFDIGRNNPFQFSHINLLHSLEELEKLPSPKVVLTTSNNLEYGNSLELFLQWAEHHQNTIIFTTRVSPNSIADKILKQKKIRHLRLRIQNVCH